MSFSVDADALCATVRETFEKWQHGEFANTPNWWEPALVATEQLRILAVERAKERDEAISHLSHARDLIDALEAELQVTR